MLKSRNLLGRRVVNRQDARSLGRVKNILVNPDKRSAEAIIIPAGNVWYAPLWLRFAAVTSAGEDILFVDFQDEPKSIRQLPPYLKKDCILVTKLWGAEVFSSKGKLLGSVADVFLKIPEGQFSGLEISHGYLDDIIHGRRLLAAGEIQIISVDAVIVNES